MMYFSMREHASKNIGKHEYETARRTAEGWTGWALGKRGGENDRRAVFYRNNALFAGRPFLLIARGMRQGGTEGGREERREVSCLEGTGRGGRGLVERVATGMQLLLI